MDYDPYDEQFYNDDDLCDECVEDLSADTVDEPEDEWLEGYWEDRLTDMYDGTY